jgi:hypothetical protein
MTRFLSTITAKSPPRFLHALDTKTWYTDDKAELQQVALLVKGGDRCELEVHYHSGKQIDWNASSNTIRGDPT